MKDILIDRRRAVRINGKFTLELEKGKSLKMGKTIDISEKGMCCEIKGRVPIFKEIQIRLHLPLDTKKTSVLSCKGVVVRCQKTAKKGIHQIAFYFTDWEPLSREKMLRFLKTYPYSEAA